MKKTTNNWKLQKNPKDYWARTLRGNYRERRTESDAKRRKKREGERRTKKTAAVDCIWGQGQQVWVPQAPPPLALDFAWADAAPEPSRVA